MSGSSGSPVTTQTQSRDPWIGAQPYLQNMYSTAQAYQSQNVGYNPYSGPTVADLTAWLAPGLGGYYNLAGQEAATGVPGLGQAQALGSNIIGQQGITPDIAAQLGTINTSIQNLNAVGAAIPGLYGAVGQTASLYPGFIAGVGGAAQQYRDIYGQAQQAQNPYLQAQIDAQNRLVQDRIQSSMSGAGRYGSGQYSDVMARAQAEVADPILAADYEARQNRALQATQGLTGAYGQMGSLAGQQAGLYGQQAALLGQQAGLYGQQASLAGGLANIYGQGLGRAGQWAEAMPSFAQGQFQPYQNMMTIGNYMQDRAQQQLQGDINYYNALQAYPWQELERQAAIMAGAGQLGGTTITAASPQQASLGARLAGGALLGGSLGSAIPGIGTGLGALGGAGLGAFL